MSMRFWPPAGPLAVLFSLIATFVPAAAPPIAASCMPLDLSAVARGPTTSVFAGTVTRSEADHVWMQVERWFLGSDPVESVEIVGGSQPNAITSIDWRPSPGEQYLVVAEKAAPTGFITRPCQQTSVSVAVLQAADVAFGAGREPPFATPTPAPAPRAASDDATVGPRGLLPLLLAIALGGALVGLALFLSRRRTAPNRPR